MERSEAIIFPFPLALRDLLSAATAFEAQFLITPCIHLRGHVQLSGEVAAYYPDWTQVGGFDLELDLVGIGDPEEDEETFGWVVPCGPGEIRLSTANWHE